MRIDTLLLTILLELIVYIFVLKVSMKNKILFAVLVNIITQPVAQYLFRSYYYSGYYEHYGFYTVFLVIESLVVISEMYLIAGLTGQSRKTSFRISLLANFVSAFTGLIIYSYS